MYLIYSFFMCRRSEKWEELGGLQSGLSLQHRGANLHRQQPAASCWWSRLPAVRSSQWGRGSGAHPDPVPDYQPGPQPDLPGPIDPPHKQTFIHGTLTWYTSSPHTVKMIIFMLFRLNWGFTTCFFNQNVFEFLNIFTTTVLIWIFSRYMEDHSCQIHFY